MGSEKVARLGAAARAAMSRVASCGYWFATRFLSAGPDRRSLKMRSGLRAVEATADWIVLSALPFPTVCVSDTLSAGLTGDALDRHTLDCVEA